MKSKILFIFSLECLLFCCQSAVQAGNIEGPDKNISWISNNNKTWVFGIDASKKLTFLGLDSEGGKKTETNLLSGPVNIKWDGCAGEETKWEKNPDGKYISFFNDSNGKSQLRWTITANREELTWDVLNSGKEPIRNLKIEIPVNALMAAAVLIPSKIDSDNHGLGPWLLVVPDFGQLLISSESDIEITGINNGIRGGGSNAVSTGIDPHLRGQAWLSASGIKDYIPGKLSLQFCSDTILLPGAKITLRIKQPELSEPEGIQKDVWNKIRRPYLNNWQPCGTWAGPKKEMVLSNNVLSDPASISLWFYSDPMLYWHNPAEGIEMVNLLKHSLDYYLDNEVSAQGHVNAFGKMYDMYVSCGGSLIISSWDYYKLSDDKIWLENRIRILHLIADYLLRRDIDKDGLIESINSGNAGTLRDPERADIWFEMMNFGYKNSWTNLISYRAFLCLAELLDEAGQHDGANYYRGKGALLREAFKKKFISPSNGWFVSWISLDGQVHDYCHTFINGMAVAYGIVPPDEGRKILEKVVTKSKTIGFNNWQLGIPANLIPCRKEDMIGPRIGIDGKPVKNDFYWPDDLTEEAAFGNRYTDGTIHPPLVWPYLLGLQVAGLNEEADRILNAMIKSAQDGLFQNGIVNVGYGGAEHFYANGSTCGYEGYLPESFNFLMACFTRSPEMRKKILSPLQNTTR